jgi:RNA ligase
MTFKSNVEKLIGEGYVTKRKHPTLDLYILNYSPQTQFERYWNEITLQCRGLVVDEEWNIVARPFKKFFNYNEWSPEVQNDLIKELCQPRLGKNFTVYEKLDGSLGITFLYKGEQIFATRGSFESEQAVEFKKIWEEKYSHIKLQPNITYLFEIIYPENRIVVDYKGQRDIYLLGSIDSNDIDFPINLTCVDVDSQSEWASDYFKTPVVYDGYKDFDEILRVNDQNFEGFVIRYSDGFRLKIKTENYRLLHKIIGGLNEERIWEMLKAGQPISDLSMIPDEFYSWAEQVYKKVDDDYLNLLEEVDDYFERIVKKFNNPSRKELALEFIRFHPSCLLFAKLDGKNWYEKAWDFVKPVNTKRNIMKGD